MGLLGLELVAAFAGFSLLGAEAEAEAGGFGADLDAPDLDAPDLDAPAADLSAPDIEADLGAAEIAGADADAAGPEASDGGGAWANFLSWIGLGKAPFLVWLATFLAAFGLAGYGLSLVSAALFGALPAAATASLLALPCGLIGAARVSNAVARLLPRAQSTAVSQRRLVGRPAVITSGRAERGRPTEAKTTDRHGQAHYVRVEPEQAGAVFEPGDKVVLLSRVGGGVFRAAPLNARA